MGKSYVSTASRRENVVITVAIIFPSHQAGGGVLYWKPAYNC